MYRCTLLGIWHGEAISWRTLISSEQPWRIWTFTRKKPAVFFLQEQRQKNTGFAAERQSEVFPGLSVITQMRLWHLNKWAKDIWHQSFQQLRDVPLFTFTEKNTVLSVCFVTVYSKTRTFCTMMKKLSMSNAKRNPACTIRRKWPKKACSNYAGRSVSQQKESPLTTKWKNQKCCHGVRPFSFHLCGIARILPTSCGCSSGQ